jgi:hypothetical protein
MTIEPLTSSEGQPMCTRPFSIVAGCLLLISTLLTGCGEGELAGDTSSPTPTPTVAAPATSATASPPTTGDNRTTTPPIMTTPPSTTTTEPAPEAALQLLVAGPEGVFLGEAGVEPVQLIEDRAATAVDDGLGGLLYQIDAGRDWDQTPALRTTIVWWVPKGSERPLDLLVPTADQSLTLEDALVIDGDLTVFYRRSEGAVSFEMVDSLRRYDHATGAVTELMRGSAWEAGFDVGSVGGGLIAGTEYGQIESYCFFRDFAGAPAFSPADPSVPGCEGPGCPDSCVVSPDGLRVANVETQFDESTNATTAYDVVVSDVATGEELERIEIPDPDWAITDLDLSGDGIIVNRSSGEAQLAAWVVNLSSPDVPAWEVPIAGVARFVTSPVTVRPAQLALRGDGLGIVELGQPEASAMPLLVARFGEPSDEWRYDPANCLADHAERCCFAQTGYGCERYYRGVVWEEAALSVIFADGDSYRDDGIPHLTYWSTWEAKDRGLATEAGMSVGATAGELRSAYGDRLVPTSVGCGDELPAYRLDQEMRMVFELSGPFDDPATTITTVWAGSQGSC